MSEAGERIRDHLLAVEIDNAQILDQVADRMYQTIQQDGLVLTAGTGHSSAMVLETFYRAGGLACVRPITHPALMPLEGGLVSTHLERSDGLGKTLAEAALPGPADTGFVFSNSGVNPVPVEIASTLKEAGTTVVAVSSKEHMSRAPQRTERKLGEVSDHVLDTMTPYGDAFWSTESGTTAALSSLAGTYLWNLLLVRLATLADQADEQLPLWMSANVEGGEERNDTLFRRYRSRIPML